MSDIALPNSILRLTYPSITTLLIHDYMMNVAPNIEGKKCVDFRSNFAHLFRLLSFFVLQSSKKEARITVKTYIHLLQARSDGKH